jgi:hypothetical protein
MASTYDSVGASVFSVVVVPPSTCSSLQIASCPSGTVLGLGLGVMGDFLVSGVELLVVDVGWWPLLAGAGVICARNSKQPILCVDRCTEL